MKTTIGDIAKVLDVHYTTIRDWVRTFKHGGTGAFPGSGNLKAEDDYKCFITGEYGIHIYGFNEILILVD